MNITKQALRSYYTRLNGIASLLTMAELGYLTLTDDLINSALETLKGVEAALLRDLACGEETIQ